MEHLAYRYDNSTWTPQFKQFLERFDKPWEETCRLCTKLHEDKKAFDAYAKGQYENLPISKTSLLPDLTCQRNKWAHFPE